MTSMTRIETSGSRTADRRVDRPAQSADVGLVRAELDAAAGELAGLWSSAFERGDFDEISRLVEASQAVHCAVIALTTDRVAPEHRLATS
jgi:hypothetical protein